MQRVGAGAGVAEGTKLSVSSVGSEAMQLVGLVRALLGR